MNTGRVTCPLHRRLNGQFEETLRYIVFTGFFVTTAVTSAVVLNFRATLSRLELDGLGKDRT